MAASGTLVGGKYRLNRKIGEGGMGEVWAAKNEDLGRDVAIKLMLQVNIAQKPEALRRFMGEAKICATIRDPGIVDVLDVGTTEDGSPFMVMELLNGQPLSERLAERSLSLVEILRILGDVARTLSLAHSRGVVHRDLKPENLFLHFTPRGKMSAKILDFGVSKIADQESRFATQAGAVLGSPAYMSPEQARGEPVDLRTDIYALGVILYEAISGETPFAETPNVNALVVAVATSTPTSLAVLAPKTPAPVVELVERAMHRSLDARFATADDLANALELAANDLIGGTTAENPIVDSIGPARRGSGSHSAAAHAQTAHAKTAISAGAPVAERDQRARILTSAPVSSDRDGASAVEKSKPDGRRRALVIGGGVVALLAAAGGLLYATSSRPKDPPRAAVTVEAQPTPSPSVTPTEGLPTTTVTLDTAPPPVASATAPPSASSVHDATPLTVTAPPKFTAPPVATMHPNAAPSHHPSKDDF